MRARSKDFTIALLLTALDVFVIRDNGSAVWRLWGAIQWGKFCLLLFVVVGAFTLSNVWAYAFRQSQRFAKHGRRKPSSQLDVSGGSLEGADV
jgi:hypothetical protein